MACCAYVYFRYIRYVTDSKAKERVASSIIDYTSLADAFELIGALRTGRDRAPETVILAMQSRSSGMEVHISTGTKLGSFFDETGIVDYGWDDTDCLELMTVMVNDDSDMAGTLELIEKGFLRIKGREIAYAKGLSVVEGERVVVALALVTAMDDEANAYLVSVFAQNTEDSFDDREFASVLEAVDLTSGI